MKKILVLFLSLLVMTNVLMPTVAAKESAQASPFIEKVKDFFKSIKFINNTINFIKNIFGLVEDQPEDYADGDGSSDQTTYYEPYIYVKGEDPQDAKPTDMSISVNIKDFDITYETEDDTFEFDISFLGTTSGDVYACYWIMVVYFDDGTSSYYNVWNGPRNQQDLTLYDNNFDLTFYGKGPGGFSDWSKFEGRQFITGDVGDNEEVVFAYEDEEDYEKIPTDFVLYVRAFSDEDLTKWNQDSVSLFDDMPNQIAGESEENQDTPGFEMIAFIFAIGLLVLIYKKKK